MHCFRLICARGEVNLLGLVHLAGIDQANLLCASGAISIQIVHQF
jgi:hypothetical protein